MPTPIATAWFRSSERPPGKSCDHVKKELRRPLHLLAQKARDLQGLRAMGWWG